MSKNQVCYKIIFIFIFQVDNSDLKSADLCLT